MDNLPELTIAEGILARDAATIALVYKTLGPKIIGFVMNNSGTKEDGKELFQEAYLKAYQNLTEGKYQESGKFEAWFNQIARNLWFETLRQRNRSAAQNLDDAPPIPDNSTENLAEVLLKNRYLEALHAALQRLGEPCASLLTRFHGEESVSSKELAEELGKSDGAIRVQLRRCREKLLGLFEADIRRRGCVIYQA